MGDSFLVTRARGAAGCWKGYGPLATRGGEVEEGSTKFYIYGEAPPQGPPPYPFIYHF